MFADSPTPKATGGFLLASLAALVLLTVALAFWWSTQRT